MNLDIKPQFTKLGLQAVADCLFRCAKVAEDVKWLSFQRQGLLCSGQVYFDVIWFVALRLSTLPALVIPIALARTPQIPPLLYWMNFVETAHRKSLYFFTQLQSIQRPQRRKEGDICGCVFYVHIRFVWKHIILVVILHCSKSI